MRHARTLVVVGQLCFAGMVFGQATTEKDKSNDALDALQQQAVQAFQQGNNEQLVRIATQLLDLNSNDVEALLLRAAGYDRLRMHKQAIADFDRTIKLVPRDDARARADLYHQRGRSRFKLGDVKGSIADFHQETQLDPTSENRNWELGISYYYDGQYAKGARQFELYQTYRANDVENVIWRFVCQARAQGSAKARASMLTLQGTDKRIPMMQIYSLFRGEVDPHAVFAAAKASSAEPQELKERMFYAHLYVALYYAAVQNQALAERHIREADRLKISHYMWDVAHLHARRLGRRTG